MNKNNLTGTILKKYQHKKKILSLLYKYEAISGPSISKRIGVSLPTASALLNELSELNYIEIKGTGKSSGGRKPVLFGLSSSFYVIACEVERYRAKIVIYNSHNQAVTPIVKFETSIDDNQLTNKIIQNANQLIEEHKIDQNKILGLGVTMPGLVDVTQGINYTIKNKSFQNIRERLQKKFDKMVYINNDARMQAYGEYVFGAAKNHKNSIVVTWSYGIGMGIIADGNLYNGSTGFAGEFSHIQFEEDGNLCICGKRGCLETVASAYVLVNEAKKGLEENQITQLTEQFKDSINDIKPEDIINAAKNGDEFSIQLLHNIGLALGKGLSITIQLLNPEIIVLGGPVSEANQFVFTPIQQALNKFCLEQVNAGTKFQVSEIWEQSGLLGVTAMIFQELLSSTNHLINI